MLSDRVRGAGLVPSYHGEYVVDDASEFALSGIGPAHAPAKGLSTSIETLLCGVSSRMPWMDFEPTPKEEGLPVETWSLDDRYRSG